MLKKRKMIGLYFNSKNWIAVYTGGLEVVLTREQVYKLIENEDIYRFTF